MTKCTTHHHACDCREEKFREQEALLREVQDINVKMTYQQAEREERIAELEAFLIKLRDSGEWYYSALEFNWYKDTDTDADGQLLKEELDALLEGKEDE